MPRDKKTHDDCLKAVCFFCLRKSQNVISESIKSYIVNNVSGSYQSHASFLPSGICNYCQRSVYDLIQKGSESKRTLPLQDYLTIAQRMRSIPPQTRSSPNCACYICEIAHSKSSNAGPTQISDSMLGISQLSNTSTAGSETSVRPKTLTICSRCYQRVGLGIVHACEKGNKAIQNLMEMLSPSMESGLAAAILRKKQGE